MTDLRFIVQAAGQAPEMRTQEGLTELLAAILRSGRSSSAGYQVWIWRGGDHLPLPIDIRPVSSAVLPPAYGHEPVWWVARGHNPEPYAAVPGTIVTDLQRQALITEEVRRAQESAGRQVPESGMPGFAEWHNEALVSRGETYTIEYGERIPLDTSRSGPREAER